MEWVVIGAIVIAVIVLVVYYTDIGDNDDGA